MGRTAKQPVEAVQVAVVQPRELLRAGLERTLGAAGYAVVCSVENGAELKTACAAGACFQLVVLDLCTRAPDGFVLMAWLRESLPEVGIVGVCVAPDEATVQRAMRRGAGTVLGIRVQGDALHAALQDVLNRRYHLSALLRDHCMGHTRVQPQAPPKVPVSFKKLSDRELEYVLYATAPDRPKVDSIAQRMGIQCATVCSVRRNVYAKLGIHTEMDLLWLAIRAGLVRL